MKRITTIGLTLSALISLNVFAAESKEKQEFDYMGAGKALSYIQKIKPAIYDGIELTDGKEGKPVYIAYPAEQNSVAFTIVDGQSGQDLSSSYPVARYDLAAVIESVEQSHEGKIVSVHKEFTPETGYIYLVELEHQHDDLAMTLLAINADTLKVMDSERFDVDEYDQQEEDFTLTFDSDMEFPRW